MIRRVLVIGDINADLIVSDPDPRPVFGQVERLVAGGRLTIGGSAGIFACGLTRLGSEVALVGTLADDPLGRLMRAMLAERGVDTSPAPNHPSMSTGLSVILASPTDRAILTVRGALAELQARMISGGLVRSVDHVHVASYYLLDRLRPDLHSVLAAARATGASVSLDTNYDPAERWTGEIETVLPLVDVFLPNEGELRSIAGTDRIEAAADRLLDLVSIVAVKRGADGALVRSRDGGSVAAQPPAVDALDSTGAGDSFDAGFVHGWLAGWDLARALRLAVACGALSTRALGGVDAQPTLDEALGAVGAG